MSLLLDLLSLGFVSFVIISQRFQAENRNIWFVHILMPILIWLTFSTAPWTNALDAGLIRVSPTGIGGTQSPWIDFALLPTLPNLFSELVLKIGIAPDVAAGAISLLGITLWYVSYSLIATIVSPNQIVVALIASVLTIVNPIVVLASDIFGFVGPSNGNSTYGMLGLALLCTTLSLYLRGFFYLAAISGLFLLWTSPVNWIPVGALLCTTTFWYLYGGSERTKGRAGLGFLFATSVSILYLNFKGNAGHLSTDSNTFRTYVELWDSHRNAENYQLSAITCLIVVLAIALAVWLAKNPKVMGLPCAYTRIVSWTIASILLIILLLDVSQRIALGLSIVQSVADFPFVALMPLRLVEMGGFIFTIIGMIFLQKYRRITPPHPAPFPNTLVYTILFLVPLSSWTATEESRNSDTWLTYYALNRQTNYQSIPQLGVEADISSTLSAPGLSDQAIWGMGLPVLLNTENGIDFIMYNPKNLGALVQIIELGYGITFGFPSVNPRCGCIPQLPEVKTVWESRSADEWKVAAGKVGFDSVFAPSSWNIDLPEISTQEGTVLYEIPR